MTAAAGLQVKEGEALVPKAPPAIQTKPAIHKDTSSSEFLAQDYLSSPPPPDCDKDPFEGRVDGLYLILISLHGLVRGERMELGRDPDTGGQVISLTLLFST
jgi:sucrose-phosphate synthase